MSKQAKSMIIFLLALFCINVGVYEKYLLMALVVIYIFSNRFLINIPNHAAFFTLVFWGICYFFMWILEGNEFLTGLVYYIIGPTIMSCCLCKLIQSDDMESVIQKYTCTLVWISIAFFLHGTIDVIYSLTHNVFQFNTELVYDVLSGQKINRTVVGMYLTPIVCVGIPALFTGKGILTARNRVFLYVLTLISIFFSIFLGNRTLLIIVAIEILLCYVYGVRTKANKKVFVYIPLAVVVILSLSWIFNVGNIQEFIQSSFLMRRLTSGQTDNSRFHVYGQIFISFFDYIFGWITARQLNATIGLSYAHNLWLDCLIYAGVIPFFLLIAYTVCVISDALKVYRRVSNPYVQLVTVCLTFGILLNWMAEPVLYADPYYFAVFCGLFACFGEVAGNYL